jgi:hypothetical protein
MPPDAQAQADDAGQQAHGQQVLPQPTGEDALTRVAARPPHGVGFGLFHAPREAGQAVGDQMEAIADRDRP